MHNTCTFISNPFPCGVLFAVTDKYICIKPLSEPMWTKISNATGCHEVTID